ncbi:MAG: type I-E CRISPR-associated protein Cas5/CasD, partial [Myxococcota bacterium]
MRFLVVTLKGPMMSFGGAKVDAHHVTRRHPGQSMVAGLIANALGYHHRDWERTQRLQRRLRYACRADRDGHVLEDYHTVDLGQEHLLSDRGWTTQGALEERAGGSASTTTHIRQRDYIADGVRTLVLRLEPARETPTLDDIHRALSNPERPLFIGRKCCVPSRPLVRSEGAFVHASSLEEALRAAPWP